MYRLFLIYFLLLSLGSKSQSLGWTYENCLNSIKSSEEYSRYEANFNGDKGYYIITCFFKNNSQIAEAYYFNYETYLCFQINLVYPLDSINYFIQNNNENYVRVSELKWKDYNKGFFLEIERTDKLCIIKMYE